MSDDGVQVTAPDLNRLWQVYQRVRMAQLDALVAEVDGIRWRFTRSDWLWMLRDDRVRTEVSGGPGAWRLFGWPVDEVDDALGRWPELVLVVDRRV